MIPNPDNPQHLLLEQFDRTSRREKLLVQKKLLSHNSGSIRKASHSSIRMQLVFELSKASNMCELMVLIIWTTFRLLCVSEDNPWVMLTDYKL